MTESRGDGSDGGEGSHIGDGNCTWREGANWLRPTPSRKHRWPWPTLAMAYTTEGIVPRVKCAATNTGSPHPSQGRKQHNQNSGFPFALRQRSQDPAPQCLSIAKCQPTTHRHSSQRLFKYNPYSFNYSSPFPYSQSSSYPYSKPTSYLYSNAAYGIANTYRWSRVPETQNLFPLSSFAR